MTYTNSSSLYTAMGPMISNPKIIGETILESVLDPVPVKLILEESYLFSRCVPLIAVLVLLYVISNYITFFGQGEGFQKEIAGAKRILLVTAHPDDECMFFGPILTQLTSTTDVYIICLSDGGYEGQGSVRLKELWMSCEKLGIIAGNIWLYRHPLLPDNPKSSWSPLLIGDIIEQFIETLSIDALITFDAYGISGHSNHSAIYRAVMHLSGKKAIPENCRVYVLESVNIIRKYSVCIDLLFSYCTSQYLYACSQQRRKMILEAMAQHSSQLLWYRRLYLVFSRYAYINTLKAIS